MNNKTEKLQHKRYTTTVLELAPPTDRDFVFLCLARHYDSIVYS